MFNMMSSNIATTNFVANNSRYLDLGAIDHFTPNYSKVDLSNTIHRVRSSDSWEWDTLIVASTKYAHHHPPQDILSYLLALKPSSFKPKISTSGISV
ncbi:hypothetical protein CK203_083989 [Vitis vinifera]|uniref:Uncharacterized protein n=1 Tax=Vitis vinifera TaxID=29760 RepID=A0A438EUY1_VITVI|nr:hypothetical protein CK203_083989 [Vitis vinifera]